MRIDESQKTSICRSSTAFNQPLTGRNRRERPKCVNPILPASLIMWDEMTVVSNTVLSNIFYTRKTITHNPHMFKHHPKYTQIRATPRPWDCL